MGLESVTNLRLDFVKSRYVSVNAKQFDKAARRVVVSCYDNGQFVKILPAYNYAYLRFRRVDGKCMFLVCKITKDGKISFVLKKPMLDVVGKCWADIVIVAADKPNLTQSIGLFAIGNATESGEQVFYPLPLVDSDDNGDVVITSVSDKEAVYPLNSDPSPFITDDNEGNVIMASILDSGEIVIEEANIISTMPFCVNVIKSAYFEENTGFIM